MNTDYIISTSPHLRCTYLLDNNKREQEWDRKTYQALFKVAKEHPDLCEVSRWKKSVT